MTTLIPGPIEGVVVEQPCQAMWSWDDFYTTCDRIIDGHTKHRWTYDDKYTGEIVVIEWESYWGELPEEDWDCPDCEHKHWGSKSTEGRPRSLRGICPVEKPHSFWIKDCAPVMIRCTCPRRRPNKETT